MKIVIGVDGRERQFDPVALGRLLARSETDEILVVHVYPFDWVVPPVGTLYDETMRRDSQPIVEAAGRALGRPYRPVVFGDSSPARGLHRLAERERADLLVIGSSHRAHTGRVLPGGVGERIVHGAPCAVAVAPRGFADTEPHIRRVGVAYDASPEAQTALEWAQDLARETGADLTLYRVVESPTVGIYPGLVSLNVAIEDTARRHEDELRHAVDGIPAELHPRGEVVHGRTAEALATAAGEEDVFVTGSRGYGALRTVLVGSVARSLLAHAKTPVVILARAVQSRPDPLPEPGALEVVRPSAANA
jgi:nucleotide-binding universal stress UspA family protein